MPEAGPHRGDAWTIGPDESVRAAADRMKLHGVGLLVVVEGRQPIGMLSDRDLALGVLRKRLDPDSVRVRELMSAPAVTIPEGTPARAAARVLRERGLRRLPRVGAEGELVGIVALDDLLRKLAGELSELARVIDEQPARQTPDLEARRREAEITWSE
jgi:CBS domain-containing protein